MPPITEHMYDLRIEPLPGGGLRLEQEAGSLEGAVVIDLHPAQIRLLAERAGLLATSTSPAIEKRVLARFERLLIDVEYLAGDIWLDEIYERLGDGLAFRIAMVNAADELRDLVETLTECVTREPLQASEDGNETQRIADASKPGRKPIGERAMTSTERSQRHRAKQPEQLTLEDSNG